MDAQLILRIAEYVAAIGAGIAAVNQWIIKPLKRLMDKQREKLDTIEKTVNMSKDDIADILGDRLSQAHEHFMAQGWCSVEDKKRFIDLHKRYAARGHNHLSAWFEEELLALPDKPTVSP